MSTIQIILDSNEQQVFCYKICGLKVLTNKELNSLSAFGVDHKYDEALSVDKSCVFENGVKFFQGVSWLAEKNREINCSKLDEGYLIDVPEISKFFINSDGSKIIQYPNPKQEDYITTQQLEYTVLGPPLMLAFAMNRLLGLHASSVEIAGKAVLFTGESGFGKSTIAQYLNSETGLPRRSDDISIISRSAQGFALNTDFPQLKLSDDAQNAQFNEIELGAIILLSRKENNTSINLARLNSADSIKVLLNHGVAAQLFDKRLANQHLRFMADLTEYIPVYKLGYPNGLDQINSIAKILNHEFD